MATDPHRTHETVRHSRVVPSGPAQVETWAARLDSSQGGEGQVLLLGRMGVAPTVTPTPASTAALGAVQTRLTDTVTSVIPGSATTVSRPAFGAELTDPPVTATV